MHYVKGQGWVYGTDVPSLEIINDNKRYRLEARKPNVGEKFEFTDSKVWCLDDGGPDLNRFAEYLINWSGGYSPTWKSGYFYRDDSVYVTVVPL